MSANVTTENPSQSGCMADRHMWYYIGSSLATLGLAVVIVLIPRLLNYYCRRLFRSSSNGGNSSNDPSKGLAAEDKVLLEPSMYTNVQNWAGDLISGNTATGRFLVVFAFFCSIAALVVYIWGESSDIKMCLSKGPF